MAGPYAKVAVIGSAEGQEIVNIFYFFCPDDPESALNPAARTNLATEWGTIFQGAVSDLLSADYLGTEIHATAVNHLNETVSDYAVVVPNPTIGTVAGGSDSVGLGAIVGFRCSPVPFELSPVRLPKKSYVVLGPVASANVGDGGALLWNVAEKLAVTQAFSTPFIDSVLDITWVPSRVGIPNDAGQGATGYVDDAIVRPYVRPRKSRMVRANGR